jgi:hypothetical protein
MPAGHGLYPLALSVAGRRTWEKTIETWLNSGVRLTLIVSSPNEQALEYWKAAVQRFPPNLRVYFLDRRFATRENAIQIEKLDTFHPTLIFNKDRPLGMWVEGYHHPNSPIAHNVEYTAENGIVDFQRARFNQFYHQLGGLIDETRHPAHLSIVTKGPEEGLLEPVSQKAK